MPTTNVRIPQSLRERIDQARGDIPRERWIRRALENALEPSQPNPRTSALASRDATEALRTNAFRKATQ